MEDPVDQQRLLHWLLGALALAGLVGLWFVTDVFLDGIRALLG
jgi:hypothetical protein